MKLACRPTALSLSVSARLFFVLGLGSWTNLLSVDSRLNPSLLGLLLDGLIGVWKTLTYRSNPLCTSRADGLVYSSGV